MSILANISSGAVVGGLILLFIWRIKPSLGKKKDSGLSPPNGPDISDHIGDGGAGGGL